MAKYAEFEEGKAIFSDGRWYRYVLEREWDASLPPMMMIGLNPSTADERRLDPTLRKVIGYARREGCGKVCMTNLFALRATDPLAMRANPHPVGDENDTWLTAMAWDTKAADGLIVCGWGTHGIHQGRDRAVRALLKDYPLKALKITQGGHPSHPLYLRSDAPLIPFA